MSKIRHATFNEFRKIVESLEQELTGSLPYCESGTQPDFSPELVSFELGRALGRLEGYSDYYYVSPGASLQRRFLSRKVRPCVRTIAVEFARVHGKVESDDVTQPLWAWFELAMSDLGVDYETLE